MNRFFFNAIIILGGILILLPSEGAELQNHSQDTETKVLPYTVNFGATQDTIVGTLMRGGTIE